ncbi:kinetochore Sim4 complex subunit FTA2-domain-containing protein [Xylaria castorea]|nr:kinetochore Sim4 complex subunit FTA2-domain-containing protein [Xylaria castorea]
MPSPLPHLTTGPKLKAFEGNIESIKFIELLGSDDNKQSSDKMQLSRVFQVSIEGKTFALNVVMKDDVVRHHIDPFYAECRAFGLLVEKNKDDELAIRCHGYVFLSNALERQIEHQFGICRWNRKAEHDGSQLRAIVKDYFDWKSPRHTKTFETMRRNLEELNKLRIYNMDVWEGNYRCGRLFDFGVAITCPHIDLWPELRPVEQILEDQKSDIECFDSMVRREIEGEECEEEPPPTGNQRTRPATKCQGISYNYPMLWN